MALRAIRRPLDLIEGGRAEPGLPKRFGLRQNACDAAGAAAGHWPAGRPLHRKEKNMPHIQQLNAHVADLIAAGEVVERIPQRSARFAGGPWI